MESQLYPMAVPPINPAKIYFHYSKCIRKMSHCLSSLLWLRCWKGSFSANTGTVTEGNRILRCKTSNTREHGVFQNKNENMNCENDQETWYACFYGYPRTWGSMPVGVDGIAAEDRLCSNWFQQSLSGITQCGLKRRNGAWFIMQTWNRESMTQGVRVLSFLSSRKIVISIQLKEMVCFVRFVRLRSGRFASIWKGRAINRSVAQGD